jgi:ATP-dependent Clp protease ATP-binding subunit ClpC
MKEFAKIHFWYESIILKFLRCLFLIVIALLTCIGIIDKIYPNFFITFFLLFIILEIFFKFKISRLMPKHNVLDNSGSVLDSFSLEALGVVQTQEKSANMVQELLKFSRVQFIVFKADAILSEIKLIDIDKDQLETRAFALSRELKGKYVTTMDLFVAYLLLSESTTKFLFNKKLKEEDIKNILFWAKNTYAQEESSKKIIASFAGEGIAENWVYGWTIETQKYMIDLSHEFLSEKQSPIGRQNEYKQMIEALYKGGSVILVGDAGSGKESAVKELAIESFLGKTIQNLFHQKIFQLMVDAFMAGAQNQGELEQRLDAMIEEVAHSGNVIIYIPEFQNIMGSSTFHLDISGAIIPYLQKGEIRIIAAVTPGAYKKFIEPMHTLLDSFTVINFSEPTHEEVLKMLFRKTALIEEKNRIVLSYKAVIASSIYADKYAKEKVLPGSAVILLEDSVNAARLTNKKIVKEQDILDQVEKKTKVSVGAPKIDEKKLLLNLETELHKRIISQNEAVFSLAESIRRLRTGLETKNKPISFLFLGPTGVGKTETAKALADIYFGNSARLVRLDMSEFAGSDGMRRLLGSGPGEGDDKGQLTEPVYDSPYSLVLLDEFEKADQKILDLFLQVLDDGRLTDNKGRTISFVDTIIIATSNAGSEFIREEVEKGTPVDKKFQTTLLNQLQEKNVFKPELLNRFDDIIVFKPLGINEVTQIVKLMLVDVTKKLTENDIKVSFDGKIVAKIANEGFDKEFGARPLRRFIQDNIEDMIAQRMLKDEIKRGDSLSISVDSSNKILLGKI